MPDASELSSVVGFTAIAWGIVDGEVDGDDGELIKLDNEMIFGPEQEFVGPPGFPTNSRAEPDFPKPPITRNGTRVDPNGSQMGLDFRKSQ